MILCRDFFFSNELFFFSARRRSISRAQNKKPSVLEKKSRKQDVRLDHIQISTTFKSRLKPLHAHISFTIALGSIANFFFCLFGEPTERTDHSFLSEPHAAATAHDRLCGLIVPRFSGSENVERRRDITVARVGAK
jgi:hypothetical protein